MASPPQSTTQPQGSTSEQVPPGPVRILVQTRTHLVPGDVYGEKIEYMRNMICQHVWNRKYIRGPDRWNCYGADFDYPDRTCYFLVDHGMTAEHGQTPNENPPVLWYRWTGDSLRLVAIPGELPPKLHQRLERYPFTKFPPPPTTRPEPRPMREVIKMQLRLQMHIFDEDINHLKDHPIDARWIKNQVDSRL
ncbi:hypothetical protein N8I77_008381 [Diaporthe amygdali]|uniref:Uncharacterized protein n=1 Tax=Phomopsis amygdali TaxID=1214568 RepID=A0AAD9SE27_PHOAM|nr:hypothetical protein N8I77_008381 [Diaporthe amygdali]